MTKNIEFYFKGTPYQFATFAIDLGTRQLENNPLMWQENARATLPYVPHPAKFAKDTNPISLELVVDNPDVHCDLTAQFLNGRTLVTGAFSPDDWAEIETTCMRLFDELMQHELIDTLTSSQRGRRQIKMLSSTLIDAGKYQDLIKTLAESETDNVTLPRECLVKIFTNPSLRVPVEILEKVTRDDSLFVDWNRRELLQIVRGESVSSAPAPTEQPIGKSGRPTDELYDQAFTMIAKGTPQNEARQWYFSALSYSPDQQAIKNFNEAMRKRKKRQTAK